MAIGKGAIAPTIQQNWPQVLFSARLLNMNTNSITRPTLDGGKYEIIPGITLGLKISGKGRPVVIDGKVDCHQINEHTQFVIEITKTGNLAPDVHAFRVVQMEGEQWKDLVEHPELKEIGDSAQTIVPVVNDNGRMITRSASNAIKIVTISKLGIYQEWTITIVTHDGQAYLLQQHNYCEQIYRDEKGTAFLPRTRSSGKQPKRVAVVKLVEELTVGMNLPKFTAPKFTPAPTGKSLANGQAKMMWWSAHRQVGGAVTHTGEQVQIFTGHLLGDNFYLEPGTVVTYTKMVNAGPGTTFRHALHGVNMQ
jgi:hypothetical protein